MITQNLSCSTPSMKDILEKWEVLDTKVAYYKPGKFKQLDSLDQLMNSSSNSIKSSKRQNSNTSIDISSEAKIQTQPSVSSVEELKSERKIVRFNQKVQVKEIGSGFIKYKPLQEKTYQKETLMKLLLSPPI